MENFTLRLNARSAVPLYQQLYTYILEELRAGRLAGGEKLPSKRRLAAYLAISQNTVDTAYQMLVAEGYLIARPKSGFYAAQIDAPLPPRAQARAASHTDAAAPQYRYNFQTSSIDTSFFPFKTWGRIQREILAGHPELLNHGHRQGDENLRAAIAKYLHAYRGVMCSPDQIVVGAGIEYLLGLLARMFPSCVFAVENPGYSRTARILENNGVRTLFVPVDQNGMDIDALAQSEAALAYVTPSHQFPTGVTMPAGRRMALLQWASTHNRYIIEDDYDSEFRFDSKPIPSLQGLDSAGRVIYISTFSKSIAPAIRIGYMVLPLSVLAMYQHEFGFYSSTVSRFEQQTLCRFLEEGHFARHLNRIRNGYRLRRDAFVNALYAHFGRAHIQVSGSHTGLHLLLQVRADIPEAELVALAEARGIHLNGLSAYYRTDRLRCPPATVVLGYSALDVPQLHAGAAALYDAWRPALLSPRQNQNNAPQ